MAHMKILTWNLNRSVIFKVRKTQQ